MNRPLSSTLAGLALGAVSLAGVLGLSACGGADESAAPQADGQSSSASSQGPASEAPSSEAPASEAPASEEPSGDSGDSDASKPDRKDVEKGLAKFYEEKQGLSKKDSKAFATCMMDQMYDKASAKTLTAMMKGKPENMDKADQQLIVNGGVDCAKEIS